MHLIGLVLGHSRLVVEVYVVGRRVGCIGKVFGIREFVELDLRPLEWMSDVVWCAVVMRE